MEERYELFTSLMTKVNRNIRKIKNCEMAAYDLRSAHISCLYYLYASDAETATDLAEKCEEDKATVSRALDYLEDNGYLVRAVGAKRYKRSLSLTEKGEEAGRRIAEKIARVLEEISVDLDEEERVAFYRALQVISDRLDIIAAGLEAPAERTGVDA